MVDWYSAQKKNKRCIDCSCAGSQGQTLVRAKNVRTRWGEHILQKRIRRGGALCTRGLRKHVLEEGGHAAQTHKHTIAAFLFQSLSGHFQQNSMGDNVEEEDGERLVCSGIGQRPHGTSGPA